MIRSVSIPSATDAPGGDIIEVWPAAARDLSTCVDWPLVAPDRVLGHGWMSGLAAALEGRSRVALVCATTTAAFPPLSGCGVRETADRLAVLESPTAPSAVPPADAVYIINPAFLEATGCTRETPLLELWACALADGWHCLAAPTSYVYAPPAKPPAPGTSLAATIAARLPQAQRSDPRPAMWRAAARIRVRDGRPRVYFWSQHAQHCGGMLAQVELVNRLCDRNINAALVLAGDNEGDWRRFTAASARFTPIFLPGQDPAGWLAAGGSREGIVLTSNFFSGPAVRRLCAAFPGLKPRVFPQGRDDLMAHDDGTPRWERAAFDDYLALMAEHGGVVNGRWVADSMARDLGVDTSKLTHIPIGVDTELFLPSHGMRLLGGDRKFRVLAMHREHSPERGTPMLRRVLAAAAALPGVEVLTYGNSPSTDAGPSQIPGVRHLGVLTQCQVAMWCQVSHALIDCSIPTGHGAGMSAMEMAATGGVVIRTPSLGLNEIMRDGEHCFVARDEAQMMAILADLVRNAAAGGSIAELIGNQARAHMVSRFSWDVVADQFAVWTMAQ